MAPPRQQSAAFPRRLWGRLTCVRWATQEVLANDNIPFNRLRVVDDEGLLGDFALSEALALARQRKTDLVVLTAAVEPPLCRLVHLDAYMQELAAKEEAKDRRKGDWLLREFSFDPALKVKGMRFTAMIDEHDLERKVNQVRQFLDKGHRVEVQIRQGRCPPEDVLDLSLRICAEVRDIAKPEGFEASIRDYQESLTAPISLKKSKRAPSEDFHMRLWPCTPDQAAAFKLPASVLGPRRRRGPRIAGIDDVEDEDAWKMLRKYKFKGKDKVAKWTKQKFGDYED